MVLSLSDISRLLFLVKVYEKESKALRMYVKKTFSDEPVKKIKLPNYDEVEDFCDRINLIKIHDDKISLTNVGIGCSTQFKKNFLDEKFAEIIIHQCLLQDELGLQIQSALSKFHKDGNKRWYHKWGVYDLFDEPSILPILYETNFLEKKDLTVEINTKFGGLVDFKKTKKKISLKQLEKQIENQKIIGDIAEEIVLGYEKNRLKKEGLSTKLELVKRISLDYSNAGYDIESFTDGATHLQSNRFIEVKGTTGKKIDFHWSSNEIKISQECGEKYWIYFVSEINISTKKSPRDPIMIQNPYTNIFLNASYEKKIEGYHVQKIDE